MHYDYGMRTVRAIVEVAGQLKKENWEIDEERIILRSVREANVPKFLHDDSRLFMYILKDTFMSE
jgi:dynein heavy chain